MGFIKLVGGLAIPTLFMTSTTKLPKGLKMKEDDLLAKNMLLAFSLSDDHTVLTEIVFKVEISRR